MKTLKYVIIANATLKQSFLVIMVNVSQFCGNAILTTTVGTTQTNLPIFVETKIAPLDGADVQVMLIIDVFPNGCSAMVKLIVVTVP